MIVSKPSQPRLFVPLSPPADPALPYSYRLTVRLLEPGAGATTTELLGLAATVVGDEEGAVVLGQGGLEGVLAVLVDVLLVVGDQGLGDGLADGVDLGSVATAADADADVDLGELVDADDEEGLVDLFIEHMSVIFGSPRNIARGFVKMVRTLKRRTEGSTRWRGLPLTLTADSLARISLHPVVFVFHFDPLEAHTQALAVLRNGDSGGGPLLAEASNALGGRRHGREGLVLLARVVRSQPVGAFALESSIVEGFAPAGNFWLD